LSRILAIEIGGTKLQLVVGNERGEITHRHRDVVNRRLGGEGIRRQIEIAIPTLLAGKPIDAVGVGFGGPVDWQSGRIWRSHHIEGWSEFDLAGWLQPLTNAPVIADNDANVAALGEATAGAGVGYDPVFYVTLGSGVGGGLVVGGKIYHGAKPGEAEIGHVRLDREGTIVESRCSGWSVDARIRTLIKDEPHSALARLNSGPPGGEAKHLAAALAEGDSLARRIVHETGADLALALSHVVQLLHPAIIILGGGLTGVGEPLRAEVERELRRNVMDAFAPGPSVRLSGLGEDVVPVGALKLAAMSLEFGAVRP
jgi:glucokinase